MKSSFILASAVCAAIPWLTHALTRGPEFVRINKTDAVVIVADLQVGLYHVARDYNPTEFRNNIIAHAAISKLFDLPIVLTTSAEQGPNGPLPKEILQLAPHAAYIQRHGEVDAWDNAEFREAVRATGKSQIILAGITTDVCTLYLALSLRAEGYTVFANTEASGTFSKELAADANRRMENSGVILMGLFSVVMDLMRDWRNTPGSATVLPFIDTYLPAYGYIARAHEGAVKNGKLQPGEDGL
ncbi:hypothetical protein MMC29_005401 [Sticta canariensis]|nr:hypothetical protein [Sticta canariensis]